MSKKFTPCQHCGRKQFEFAVLCVRCSVKEEIRRKHGILISADIDLKDLTLEQRMMAFIYCATGDAAYFDRPAIRSVKIEEDDLEPPSIVPDGRKWHYQFRTV